MKQSNIIVLLLVLILVLSSCEDKVVIPPLENNDCSKVSGFLDTYSDYFNKEKIFYLQGVIINNTVAEYGLKIKIQEDLKGNYNGKEKIIFWQSLESSDFLNSFKRDEKIILLTEFKTWEDEKNVEHEDYFTIDCHHSILKLSNGNVIGGIYGHFVTDTISYEKFQSELANRIIIKNYSNENTK